MVIQMNATSNGIVQRKKSTHTKTATNKSCVNTMIIYDYV